MLFPLNHSTYWMIIRRFHCVQPECFQLFSYLSKLKDFRMYLRLCLYGDSSCLSIRSMFFHPASARAVNAPHASSRHLFRLIFLMPSALIQLFPDKCFTPEGPSCFPHLSASCFEGPPYVSATAYVFFSSMLPRPR